MLVKCSSCKREFDLPADKFRLGNISFLCPNCKNAGNMLSKGELEFAASELPLLIHNYRLRHSEREVIKMLDMTAEMVNRGVIKQTPEGIGQLWAEIFKRSPEIERHIQEFISTLWQETLQETLEGKKQNKGLREE
ncbi:MAG TPA: hypothetical protein VF790_05980 [Dissulfurispiraceae bacterium]